MYFGVTCLILLQCISINYGSVTLEVGLLKYKHLASDVCDDFLLFRHCDPFFEVCFKTPPDYRCDMVKTTHANEKDELTDILKDHDIKPNPISKSMDAWHNNITIKIQIWDADFASQSKIDVAVWRYSGPANVTLAQIRLVGKHNKASVTVYIKINCDRNYYGPSCTNLCLRTANSYCNKNGKVICNPGFTGSNCNIPTQSTIPKSAIPTNKPTSSTNVLSSKTYNSPVASTQSPSYKTRTPISAPLSKTARSKETMAYSILTRTDSDTTFSHIQTSNSKPVSMKDKKTFAHSLGYVTGVNTKTSRISSASMFNTTNPNINTTIIPTPGHNVTSQLFNFTTRTKPLLHSTHSTITLNSSGAGTINTITSARKTSNFSSSSSASDSKHTTYLSTGPNKATELTSHSTHYSFSSTHSALTSRQINSTVPTTSRAIPSHSESSYVRNISAETNSPSLTFTPTMGYNSSLEIISNSSQYTFPLTNSPTISTEYTVPTTSNTPFERNSTSKNAANTSQFINTADSVMKHNATVLFINMTSPSTFVPKSTTKYPMSSQTLLSKFMTSPISSSRHASLHTTGTSPTTNASLSKKTASLTTKDISLNTNMTFPAMGKTSPTKSGSSSWNSSSSMPLSLSTITLSRSSSTALNSRTETMTPTIDSSHTLTSASRAQRTNSSVTFVDIISTNLSTLSPVSNMTQTKLHTAGSSTSKPSYDNITNPSSTARPWTPSVRTIPNDSRRSSTTISTTKRTEFPETHSQSLSTESVSYRRPAITETTTNQLHTVPSVSSSMTGTTKPTVLPGTHTTSHSTATASYRSTPVFETTTIQLHSVPANTLSITSNIRTARIPNSRAQSGKGKNVGGIKSPDTDQKRKQTHNFLWGIGLSAGILLIVGIGSLVLYKLKRRRKLPAVVIDDEFTVDDNAGYKGGQLRLQLNKLEVIPECVSVDNPTYGTLGPSETDG